MSRNTGGALESNLHCDWDWEPGWADNGLPHDALDAHLHDFQKLIGLTVPLQSSMGYDGGCLATLPQLPNAYMWSTLLIEHGREHTRPLLIFPDDFPCGYFMQPYKEEEKKTHGFDPRHFISEQPRCRVVASVA